ncbi:MAG: hypothetical protein ABSE63_01960 [Thermoguttaceae bacterium]|jgi:hypothetical protein
MSKRKESKTKGEGEAKDGDWRRVARAGRRVENKKDEKLPG